MNTQAIQPQDPQKNKEPNRFLKALALLLKRPGGAGGQKALSVMEARWAKLMRDAEEIEAGCDMIRRSFLTADREDDPEKAQASVADAERQMRRVSELMQVFKRLTLQYRANFQPGQAVIRRIKNVTTAATFLKERKEEVRQGLITRRTPLVTPTALDEAAEQEGSQAVTRRRSR